MRCAIRVTTALISLAFIGTTAGAPPSESAEDDGCGCRQVGTHDAGGSPGLVALALFALGIGRRRR